MNWWEAREGKIRFPCSYINNLIQEKTMLLKMEVCHIILYIHKTLNYYFRLNQIFLVLLHRWWREERAYRWSIGKTKDVFGSGFSSFHYPISVELPRNTPMIYSIDIGHLIMPLFPHFLFSIWHISSVFTLSFCILHRACVRGHAFSNNKRT